MSSSDAIYSAARPGSRMGVLGELFRFPQDLCLRVLNLAAGSLELRRFAIAATIEEGR